MKFKRLIIIIFVVIIFCFFINLCFLDESFVVVGQLNTEMIEKIELSYDDEKILISNIDDINAILSCMNKIKARTYSDDVDLNG